MQKIIKGSVVAKRVLHGKIDKASSFERPFYEGDYQVTPTFSTNLSMKTKGCAMKDDVTILKMPQYEVSNSQGGKTLILGDEYYGN